jgi:hypothetical protein
MYVEGTISEIYPETMQSNKTGKDFTVWKMNLEDGDVIDCGFNQPSQKIGEYYGAECEKSYGKWKPVGVGGGSPRTVRSAGKVPNSRDASPSRKPTFPIDPLSKENAIIRQNSLTNAVNSIQNGVGNAWDLSTKDGRKDYAEAVIELAYEFHAFSSGARETKVIEAQMSIDDREIMNG